jgi:hypothetical protein
MSVYKRYFFKAHKVTSVEDGSVITTELVNGNILADSKEEALKHMKSQGLEPIKMATEAVHPVINPLPPLRPIPPQNRHYSSDHSDKWITNFLYLIAALIVLFVWTIIVYDVAHRAGVNKTQGVQESRGSYVK